MKRIFVKPVAAKIVSNPFTKKKLAPGGEETLEHTYWRRLERANDVIITEVEQNINRGIKK